MLSDTALISAAKSASSLRTPTPALGRSDEPDTTVIDLSPRTLDRETARAQLIVDLLSAITAKLSAHIKDDAAVSEIVDMVLAYRRAS